MFRLLSLVILILDVIALVSLSRSSANAATSVFWTLLIIFLPFLGMILYFLVGPVRRKVL